MPETSEFDVIETDDYCRKCQIQISHLNTEIWGNRCSEASLKRWVSAWEPASSSSHATNEATSEATTRQVAHFVAANTHFFGEREITALLRTLFRSFIVPAFRKNGASSRLKLNRELCATRFIGLGAPAKSGFSLLYEFRRVNRISKDLFPYPGDLLGELGAGRPTESSEQRSGKTDAPPVRTLIFLDDFAGTGKQASKFLQRYATELQTKVETGTLKVKVYFMVATASALEKIKDLDFVTEADAVMQLDSSYCYQSEQSRYFTQAHELPFSKKDAIAITKANGKRLVPNDPLGTKKSGLLVAFQHNTPNNSLPVLWSTRNQWPALFPRAEDPEWGEMP